MRDWQRGIPLEELRPITERFAEHDRAVVRGPFTKVNDAKVAEWISRGRLFVRDEFVAAAYCLDRPRRITDFTGAVRCVLPAGALLIERAAWKGEGQLQAFISSHPGEVAVWLWQEHPRDRTLAERLGLQLAAVKVRSSSEILGLWTSVPASPLPHADQLGVARLRLPPLPVAPLAARLAGPLPFVEHYSTYNRRGSWHALTLRGFGGDPGFIEKPSEMSRKWKQEHPALLDAPVLDTPLRAALPEVEPLLSRLGGNFQRVRLMRLDAGGALDRHADITDPESGTAPGRLLRIHVPITTNIGVEFSSWGIDGKRTDAWMGAGEAWYLDTRKPHAASNGGSSDRIHLVADIWSSPKLLSLLP